MVRAGRAGATPHDSVKQGRPHPASRQSSSLGTLLFGLAWHPSVAPQLSGAVTSVVHLRRVFSAPVISDSMASSSDPTPQKCFASKGFDLPKVAVGIRSRLYASHAYLRTHGAADIVLVICPKVKARARQSFELPTDPILLRVPLLIAECAEPEFRVSPQLRGKSGYYSAQCVGHVSHVPRPWSLLWQTHTHTPPWANRS